MIGRTDEIRESQSYKEKYERKGKEFPNPFFLSFFSFTNKMQGNHDESKASPINQRLMIDGRLKEKESNGFKKEEW